MKDSRAYHEIYGVVSQIPRGRVATYGQIAFLADRPGRARQVGYALHSLPADHSSVPWHRVINAQGKVSRRGEPGWDQIQRQLLEAEGVVFDENDRIDLRHFRWTAGLDA